MGQQELLHLHIPLRHFLTFLIFTVCPSLLWGDGWLSGNLVECVVIEPHKRAHSPLRTVAIAINRGRWRVGGLLRGGFKSFTMTQVKMSTLCRVCNCTFKMAQSMASFFAAVLFPKKQNGKLIIRLQRQGLFGDEDRYVQR